jgi:hypothetical protein
MNRFTNIAITIVILFFTSGSINGEVLTPNASFPGTLYKERVGYVLCGAGDVNADGFDDFLIGAFHHSTGGYDAGAVYLILGSDTLKWGMEYSLENADARFLGRNLEAAGFAVSGRGDVNGDGLEDILIGAPAGNNRVKTWSGKMYVVFGRETAGWGKDFYLHESADIVYDGENGQDLAGRSVAIIRDLNNDGCDEMLCAAPYNDTGAEDAGKVYFVKGRSDSGTQVYKLKDATASFYATKKGATCGYSVAGIGDINNDGLDDFAIGSPGENTVYVMYGRSKMNWGPDFNLKNADLTIKAENVLKDEEVGWKVSGVGDVNGDGIADFLISAIDYDKNPNPYGRGKVYLIFGRDGGFDASELSLKNADASYVGENEMDQAGWDIGGKGDINGDGFNDFFIGAWYNDYLFEDAGKAYLIYGSEDGWEKDTPLAEISDFFSGAGEINYAGYAVSILGDLNKDNRDDYIISAPYNDALTTWGGQVYLFASYREKYDLSGHIGYLGSGQSVPNVRVTVEEDAACTDTTDHNGLYDFHVFEDGNYRIAPEKMSQEDVNDGCVTVHDAALIAMHAVKLDTVDLDLFAAADINNDGRISIHDAVLNLRYALGFPPDPGMHAGEWLFTPGGIYIENLSSNMDDLNFSAVVRGDMNGSWTVSGALLKHHSAAIMQDGHIREKDNAMVVPIAFNTEADVISFELRMKYDAQQWKFQALEYRELSPTFNVSYHQTGDGQIHIGAFSTRPVRIEGSPVRAVFKPVQTDVLAHSHVSIEKFLINDIESQWNDLIEDDTRISTFSLSQNYPNPFNGETAVRFHLSIAGPYRVSIINVLGREISSSEEWAHNAGEHVFRWHGTDRDGAPVSAGVYLFQLDYNGMKKRIKMLYVK